MSSKKLCANHIIVDDLRQVPMTDNFFKWTNRVIITVNGGEIERYEVSARLFIFNFISNKLNSSKLIKDLRQRDFGTSGNQLRVLGSGNVALNNNPIMVYDTEFGIARDINMMNKMIANIL